MYIIEIRTPDGRWQRLQWCSDYHETEASARRQAASFTALSLTVRVAEAAA